MEERFSLRKCLLYLKAGRGPQRQRVPPALAMAPIGTTDGGGGRVLEADGVMVQGLAGLPTGLDGALVLVLVQAQTQVLAMGLEVVVLEMVGMVLELVQEALEVVALVEEMAARVAKGITRHRSLRTWGTMAECTGLVLHGF